jgi:YfiH family protein
MTEESYGMELRERAIESAAGEKAVVSYLVCNAIEEAGFLNAFSTRLGGVSRLPENALNLTEFSGDDPANVKENRRRFLRAIGVSADTRVVTARQTHSTDRVNIDESSIESGADPEMVPRQPECDAMTTRQEGVLLGIQTADCLPVLIVDPVTGTAAAIHAGWRGTAGRIVERTIADLMLSGGVNPRNCIAALGPAACVECYEVGQDVIDRYKKEFGYWKKLLIGLTKEGKARLDIVAANLQQLMFCGFGEDQIYVARYCTMHQNDLFFSYRREGKLAPSGVGRLLSVVGRKRSGCREERPGEASLLPASLPFHPK